MSRFVHLRVHTSQLLQLLSQLPLHSFVNQVTNLFYCPAAWLGGKFWSKRSWPRFPALAWEISPVEVIPLCTDWVFLCRLSIFCRLTFEEAPALCWPQVRGVPPIVSVLLYVVNRKFKHSYIKKGTKANDTLKQDPQVNIWAQERWEWGVEKAPLWGTS